MSARIVLDVHAHQQLAPSDLREVDPRPVPVVADSIARVLALVETVCGPDSLVARMLTEPTHNRKAN